MVRSLGEWLCSGLALELNSLCIYLGMAASLVMVSITFLFRSRVSEACTVLGLAFYLAFFSIGVGPGNWVVISEIFATSIRAKGMCMAVL